MTKACSPILFPPQHTYCFAPTGTFVLSPVSTAQSMSHITHSTAHLQLSFPFLLAHPTWKPPTLNQPNYLHVLSLQPTFWAQLEENKKNQVRIVFNTWFTNLNDAACDLTMLFCFLSKMTYSSYLKLYSCPKPPNPTILVLHPISQRPLPTNEQIYLYLHPFCPFLSKCKRSILHVTIQIAYITTH